MARHQRRRRLPGALRLLREQRAGRQPHAEQRAQRRENVWANWSGVQDAPARRPVRHLRPGLLHVPATTRCGSPTARTRARWARTLGRRASTTIDRSKPTPSIALAGGAAATKDAKIPIQVGFSDDVAGPFPANFLCFQFGGTSNICDKNAGFIYGYTSACSVPGSGGKSTTFTCTADFGARRQPGAGRPGVGVRDRGRRGDPGQPGGPNQSASAEQGQPVRRPVRQRAARPHGPASRSRRAAAAKVGDLVSFGSQASDATSGLAGGFEWSFGDNTGSATGEAVNAHVHAGRHLRGEGQDHRRRGQPGHGDEGDHRVGRRRPAAAATTRRRRGGGSTPPPSGGGSTPPTDGGDLDDEPADDGEADFEVSAPRKLKLAKGKLPITVTTDTPGQGERRARPQRARRRPRLEVDRGGHALLQAQAPAQGQGRSPHAQGHLQAHRRRGDHRDAQGQADRQARRRGDGLHGRRRPGPRVAPAAPSGLPDGKFHGTRKRSFTPRARARRSSPCPARLAPRPRPQVGTRARSSRSEP